ncbi:diglucosyldiacylglycerol synthase (LTA membrane anchor synthesis) [Labilithrix luteola]|uniref:Diglucosyldiacylglycerol synthase (LTA membrane anchor synthesis) n=1 Tax=Labilithrix luteola TaxID=1391654 RepID=A0A0K1PQW0_9BACT|nr:glycosyltransferase [Labilithrix luteola]AKU95930.1 diglucosyldiacylglycerol synthase (LTA membrane anchor synthesis) [Labilithrix luteola]
MATTDLVVVHSPVGGGHKAAALAVAEAATARGLRVTIIDAFEHAPKWAGDAYVRAHLTGQNAAPEFYGQLYFAANRRDGTFEPLRLGIDNLLFGALADHVTSLAPRAIVATHHLPLVVLGRARRKGLLDAPVVGVVTDYTAHACWAERGVDAWSVPSEVAKAELAEHVPGERIVVTGIPVRRAFERIPSAGDADGRVRVLVTSGGFGVGPLRKIVRSFAGVPNVELTVVCGAAHKLAGQIAREAEECGVSARVLGFEKDMAARVAVADVVVGKAGGLTVTETLTAGRAMVIASAVPGNEKLNEAFVVEGGAGISAEADAVGAVVRRLADERLLGWMGARARSLVPVRAAERILNLAESLGQSARRAAA